MPTLPLPRARAGGTTVYDFDDDNVDGELLSPEGANIASRGVPSTPA
jgi:hypothetical protein